MSVERETYSTIGPECPYCGHQHNAEPEDYDERMSEGYCGECGETFDVSVYTLTSWTCTAREPTTQKKPSQ